MAGINQSIMMSLSMVVVAALMAAGGLGYGRKNLSSLQASCAGKGLLAGSCDCCCCAIDFGQKIIQGHHRKA